MEAIIKNLNDVPFDKHPQHIEVYKKNVTTSAENDRLSAVSLFIKPGGEIVPHTHDVLEVFYIIEGKGLALVNGIRQEANGGTVIIAPPGSEHGLKNVGEQDLTLYAVFSPALA